MRAQRGAVDALLPCVQSGQLVHDDTGAADATARVSSGTGGPRVAPVPGASVRTLLTASHSGGPSSYAACRREPTGQDLIREILQHSGVNGAALPGRIEWDGEVSVIAVAAEAGAPTWSTSQGLGAAPSTPAVQAQLTRRFSGRDC